ncbi:MAG: NUDIX hydrolase [Bacteroidota bacterium]
MIKPWTVLSQRYLLRRWWMNVREDQVRLPDGTVLDEFHVVEYPDWACVLCLDTNDQYVLVRQYRHGIQRVCLELPAGAVEPGEPPLHTAQRELLEETGYEAPSWHALGAVAPEPSKHTNQAHLFVAAGATRVQAPRLDHSEDLAVVTLTPAALRAAVDRGDLVHAVHRLALALAADAGLLPS